MAETQCRAFAFGSWEVELAGPQRSGNPRDLLYPNLGLGCVVSHSIGCLKNRPMLVQAPRWKQQCPPRNVALVTLKVIPVFEFIHTDCSHAAQWELWKKEATSFRRGAGPKDSLAERLLHHTSDPIQHEVLDALVHLFEPNG